MIAEIAKTAWKLGGMPFAAVVLLFVFQSVPKVPLSHFPGIGFAVVFWALVFATIAVLWKRRRKAAAGTVTED